MASPNICEKSRQVSVRIGKLERSVRLWLRQIFVRIYSDNEQRFGPVSWICGSPALAVKALAYLRTLFLRTSFLADLPLCVVTSLSRNHTKRGWAWQSSHLLFTVMGSSGCILPPGNRCFWRKRSSHSIILMWQNTRGWVEMLDMLTS